MTIEACAGLVERGDPDRFLATIAAPVKARTVLFPLYAFNLEVARAPWVTHEPMIAEMRLQWWRDVLAEIASDGPVRRHEVATPLSDALDPTAARALDRVIEARRWDIESAPFEDDAAFAAHLDATSGTLMWNAARVLGAPDESEPVIRDFAWGAGLAAWFRAIPVLEAAGKRPLVDGRPGAVKELARCGLDRMAYARKNRDAVPDQVGAVLMAGWLAGPVLRQAAADPARVAAGTLGVSEARRRSSLLFRSTTGRW